MLASPVVLQEPADALHLRDSTALKYSKTATTETDDHHGRNLLVEATELVSHSSTLHLQDASTTTDDVSKVDENEAKIKNVETLVEATPRIQKERTLVTHRI